MKVRFFTLNWEIVALIVYFVAMLAIGLGFFMKNLTFI